MVYIARRYAPVPPELDVSGRFRLIQSLGVLGSSLEELVTPLGLRISAGTPNEDPYVWKPMPRPELSPDGAITVATDLRLIWGAVLTSFASQ